MTEGSPVDHEHFIRSAYAGRRAGAPVSSLFSASPFFNALCSQGRRYITSQQRTSNNIPTSFSCLHHSTAPGPSARLRRAGAGAGSPRRIGAAEPAATGSGRRGGTVPEGTSAMPAAAAVRGITRDRPRSRDRSRSWPPGSRGPAGPVAPRDRSGGTVGSRCWTDRRAPRVRPRRRPGGRRRREGAGRQTMK